MDEVAAELARLENLRQNLPEDHYLHARFVLQHHNVLEQFEKHLARDLSEYRLSLGDVKPILRGSNSLTGEKVYSAEPYCERSILMVAMDSLLGAVRAHLKAKVADAAAPVTPLDLVERLCKRFPEIVHQLKQRGRGRSPLVMADEFDVQYLLPALLREHFDDIREEEYTPRYAGGQKRMDFLLKREEIVIETRMTREGLDARTLREELAIDIDWYQERQDCKALVCLVYDPDGSIKNPAGLIDSLENRERKIKVRVFIAR